VSPCLPSSTRKNKTLSLHNIRHRIPVFFQTTPTVQMPTVPDLCPSGFDDLLDCQRGQDAFNNVSKPSGNTSGYARIPSRVRRITTSNGAFDQPRESCFRVRRPLCFHDPRLTANATAFHFTPSEFPNSSSDTSQKALLSKYSIPSTVFGCHMAIRKSIHMQRLP